MPQWDSDFTIGILIREMARLFCRYDNARHIIIFGQLTDTLSQIFYVLQMLYIFVQYVHRGAIRGTR